MRAVSGLVSIGFDYGAVVDSVRKARRGIGSRSGAAVEVLAVVKAESPVGRSDIRHAAYR